MVLNESYVMLCLGVLLLLWCVWCEKLMVNVCLLLILFVFFVCFFVCLSC